MCVCVCVCVCMLCVCVCVCVCVCCICVVVFGVCVPSKVPYIFMPQCLSAVSRLPPHPVLRVYPVKCLTSSCHSACRPCPNSHATPLSHAYTRQRAIFPHPTSTPCSIVYNQIYPASVLLLLFNSQPASPSGPAVVLYTMYTAAEVWILVTVYNYNYT